MSALDEMDMDAILDEALDELDDSDSDSVQSENGDNDSSNNEDHDKSTRQDQRSNSQQHDSIDAEGESVTVVPDVIADSDSPAAVFQNMLKDFIEADDDGTDPDERLGQFMNQVQAQLPVDENNETGNSSRAYETEGSEEPDETKEGIEKTIAAILEEMSKANLEDAPDIGPGEFDFNPENFNPDAVIDGMMEQLLSKDLMYEPMKQVSEKFPGWLNANKDSLPPDEYEKRIEQYKCFQKLVDIYETEPNNISELLELMQQVQEYGQPPQDIISEIAPGLELDDDGMPKINPMDGIPGFGENEECIIM